MSATKRDTSTGRILIEPKRSDRPNMFAIREAAKAVTKSISKDVTASTILQRISNAKTAR